MMDAKHDAVAVTPTLGRWVSELTFAALPRDVIVHLKLCMLDSVSYTHLDL